MFAEEKPHRKVTLTGVVEKALKVSVCVSEHLCNNGLQKIALNMFVEFIFSQASVTVLQIFNSSVNASYGIPLVSFFNNVNSTVAS